MFVWFEQLLQLFALAATIFTTITLGIKNVNEIKKKTKRKRRFL